MDIYPKKRGANLTGTRSLEINRLHQAIAPKDCVSLSVRLQKQGVSCSPQWLLDGSGSAPLSIDSLTSNLEMDLHPMIDKQMDFMFKAIGLFQHEHTRCMTYLLRDETMLPVYKPGDYVGGVPLSLELYPSALNKVCIVETAQGDILVREVIQGSTPRLYSLNSLNPESTLSAQTIHDQSLARVAPVMMHIKGSYLSDIPIDCQRQSDGLSDTDMANTTSYLA